jgi:uncharacterized membrane protein YjjP (DUF1212 family)
LSGTPSQRIELLAHAGRLLLEYNESTGVIHRALAATARALAGGPCAIAVSYDGVTVSSAGEVPVILPIREVRYDTALLARVHAILDQARRGDIDPASALDRLRRVEVETPRHPRWLPVLMIGLAAAGLAALLGADTGAASVAGLSTGLGLAARQQLSRLGANLFLLPLTAAFLGAALGGLASRLAWTRSPGLAVIVPSLMLVPGPHLINGLLDLVDNHLPMSLARFCLATGLLLSSATGIVLGMGLTRPGTASDRRVGTTDHLNLASDMLLAGIVTCGFAISFNSTWAQVGQRRSGAWPGTGSAFSPSGRGRAWAWPRSWAGSRSAPCPPAWPG